jgi:hypothetical protein
MKYKRRKYDLGVQQVNVPTKGNIGDVASPALSMMGTGAQLGSQFGPEGTIIGAGVGAVTGLIKGNEDYKQNNILNKNAIAMNKYIANNQRSTDPQLQKFQAKKGLDMSKGKTQKYPGGSQAVINNTGNNNKQITSPTKDAQIMFSPSERKYLEQFKNIPGGYANATRSLINYSPKNPSATLHSQGWHEDNNAYNDAVNKFNSTYSPTRNSFSESANEQLNNYNKQNAINGTPDSTNQKLNNFSNNAQSQEQQMMGNQQGIDKSSNLVVNTGNNTPIGQKLDPKFENGSLNHYKEGTDNIHIKPENKGKFTEYKERTGETTEEALHSSDPHVRQMANFARNASKWNHKAEDGLNNIEEKKPIEVEKDELIFKKVGGRYKLKADFQGGKTHEQGGEPYTAQEGDVIYPGKQRAKVLSAYNKGDYAALETMRMKLPKDKTSPINGEGNKGILDNTMADGDQEDTTTLSAKGYKTIADPNEDTVSLSAKGYKTVGVNPDVNLSSTVNRTVDQNTSFQDNRTLSPVSQSKVYNNGGNPTLDQRTKYSPKSPVDINKVAGGVESAIQSAPTIYNSIKGTFGKPTLTTRRYISPNLMTYQDQSDPNRRQAQEQFNIDKSNSNNQVGTMGQQQSNMAQAGVAKYNRMSDINNYETNRKVGVNNANTEIKNNANQTNIGLANEYDQMDLQNKTAKNNYQSTAVTGASNLSFNREQMNNQKDRDSILAKTLSTNNMVGDAQGNQYYKTGQYKNGKEVHIGNDKNEYYNDGNNNFQRYKMGTSGISVGGVNAGVRNIRYKMKSC